MLPWALASGNIRGDRMFGWMRKKKEHIIYSQKLKGVYPCPKCEFVAESGRVLGGHMTRKDHRGR